MDSIANQRRTGGEIVHIGDCYLWAEIYYLDSATDYREYLPQDCPDGAHSVRIDNAVIRESSECSSERNAVHSLGMMEFLFVLLISGLASYCVLEVLRAAAVRISTIAG